MTSSNSNGLKTKKLNLSGRKITVSEATYMMGIQRGMAITETMENPRDDNISQNVLLNIYVNLKACSSGDIPDPDGFFKMRETDVETWIREARTLNPDWFAFLNRAEKALNVSDEDIKKKRGDPENLSDPLEVSS